MKKTLVEGFCGAGGMSLGLKSSGFDCLLAFDNNHAAIETYLNGVGSEGAVLDARLITGADILSKIGFKKGELDLFAGGPPCQGFSLQRRSGYESDDRNDLVDDYFRLVEEIQPRAFLLENVAMLGKIRGHKYISVGFSRLYQLGYSISFGIVNCANYGIPQTRKRFIAIGVHNSGDFVFPAYTHVSSEWLTVRDAIGDLPDCPEDFVEHSLYANHIRCKITKRNKDMISQVPQGGGWHDIPRELWLDCMKRWNGNSGGWPDVYGRLEWDSQCPTITAGFDSFSRGRYAHPKYDRAITPREAARIQTFPDNIRFYGTRHDVRLQIGNAVPPRLAKCLGSAIKMHLDNKMSRKQKLAYYPETSLFKIPDIQRELFHNNLEVA